MLWETSCRTLLDRAVRLLRMERLSFPYEKGFSAEYRALIAPRDAVRDALRLEEVVQGGQVVADLHSPIASLDEIHTRVQVYSPGELSLDEIMPLLQNLGLRIVDQIQFKVEIGGQRFFIRSFSVRPAVNGIDSLLRRKKPLLQLLDALLCRQAEDDPLNGLVLLTGLDWKEVDLLRAYRNYYYQLGSRFGRSRFHQALLGNPGIARLLYRYFEGRFKPDARWHDSLQREEEVLSPIRLELIAALDKVTDVNDDRILRDLFNLIDASLRTNFYCKHDQTGHFIALKINSMGVINMPSPAPMVEIYVHSPAMEGIHLRGAKVARGGIRWSDRPDDFRSEILALMQTQMIKNALIVPQGAKGGFILKTKCREREECGRLAQGAYVTLMRGLLDLTDNLEGSRVLHPPDVVAYDDDDPYLVVAADKGTAHWSDRANDTAAEYGYWLKDAFASGGSHGYDHKQLGITARGAWVCVKRHFQELGRDIDKQPFTVVGIGSMDGDVFGNGMLQSSNIRLLGAFSAEHIFLDPAPDPLAAFAERKRLFELPGSTWQDYDQALISPGGGVFRRSATDIPLSPEVRAWLGLRYSSIDGEGLIQLLLTAPVDLLWLGGIGTYVKASAESNEDAGDRANDSVRVDAIELRAKVVGEGANLGFTQKARIEYALNGGRINTDAVDNSGGVDLSDHEVTLKILMALLQKHRVIAPDEAERNRFLARLTNDVCRSVLENNYGQSLCLSLDRERSLKDAEPFLDVADQLENAGLLDREIESFPARKELKARAGQGLTRPELAVLMACAKLALKKVLLEAPAFLDAECSRDFLAAYYPEAVGARYAEHLRNHSLGREITATVICNKVINQAGASFLVWAGQLEGGSLIDAVGAYLAFDKILEGGRWREGVRALDGKMAASRQYELLLQLENALAFLSRWTLERGQRFMPDPGLVRDWQAYWRQYLDHLGHGGELHALVSAAPDVSRQVLSDRLRDFPVLVDLSRHSHETLKTVAALADAVMELFGLRQIIALLAEVKARDQWEYRLQIILEGRLRAAVARLCGMMLRTGIREPAAFFRQHGMQQFLAKFQRLRLELHETPPVALTPFAALGGELDALTDACGAASGYS
jgi:glutamate dehydrogenase